MWARAEKCHFALSTRAPPAILSHLFSSLSHALRAAGSATGGGTGEGAGRLVRGHRPTGGGRVEHRRAGRAHGVYGLTLPLFPARSKGVLARGVAAGGARQGGRRRWFEPRERAGCVRTINAGLEKGEIEIHVSAHPSPAKGWRRRGGGRRRPAAVGGGGGGRRRGAWRTVANG